MVMSNSATCGRWLAISSRAFSPSPASATTSRCGISCSSERNPARMSTWSSASNTRVSGMARLQQRQAGSFLPGNLPVVYKYGLRYCTGPASPHLQATADAHRTVAARLDGPLADPLPGPRRGRAPPPGAGAARRSLPVAGDDQAAPSGGGPPAGRRGPAAAARVPVAGPASGPARPRAGAGGPAVAAGRPGVGAGAALVRAAPHGPGGAECDDHRGTAGAGAAVGPGHGLLPGGRGGGGQRGAPRPGAEPDGGGA